MATPNVELEGTWEEILSHASHLVGRRVRLIVLSPDAGEVSGKPFWDVVGEYGGGELFHSAAEVDAYLGEERDAWDS
jgi:hypothetical protein